MFKSGYSQLFQDFGNGGVEIQTVRFSLLNIHINDTIF